MQSIDLVLILAASSAGGPSCLTSTTELAPAAGRHASVAPAKFAISGQRGGAYAYERRYLGDDVRDAVVIDSKQSQLNRVEAVLDQAIEDGHPTISRLPRVELRYEREGAEERYSDLTLPHRVFDGHIRAGTVDGAPTTQTPTYRAVRDATAADARALLDVSPVTLVFGGWDASRRSRQGRWRSCLVGEVIGFCSGQRPDKRGGARVDPVGMETVVPAAVLMGMAEGQKDELSPKLYEKIRKEADKGKPMSASPLGLGGIPPSLEQLAGVACDRIVRSHVLSFAALRQIRFGAGTDGDAACRALLVALALNGLTRSDAELYLRANCDLVEAAPTTVTIDRRGGEVEQVEALTIESADELLADALRHAEGAAGIRWDGPALRVEGKPEVLAGAVDDSADGN